MKLYDILESTEERFVELLTEEDERSVLMTCGLKLRCHGESNLLHSAKSYGIGNLDVIKIGTGSTGLLRLIVKSLKE